MYQYVFVYLRGGQRLAENRGRLFHTIFKKREGWLTKESLDPPVHVHGLTSNDGVGWSFFASGGCYEVFCSHFLFPESSTLLFWLICFFGSLGATPHLWSMFFCSRDLFSFFKPTASTYTHTSTAQTKMMGNHPILPSLLFLDILGHLGSDHIVPQSTP